MPDMTMCHGRGCPVRRDCYRHRAIPGRRQSWFGAPMKGGRCDYMLPIAPGDKLRPAEEAPCSTSKT